MILCQSISESKLNFRIFFQFALWLKILDLFYAEKTMLSPKINVSRFARNVLSWDFLRYLSNTVLNNHKKLSDSIMDKSDLV